MRSANRLIAAAVTAALMCLPVASHAQTMIGTALTPFTIPLPASSLADVEPAPQVVAFNWLANGAANPSAAKAAEALRKYRVINGSGSWICSPAGFGRRSVCYAG